MKTFVWIVAIGLCAALASPAQAEKRMALVIGNNIYPNLPSDKQLRKAVNDARSMDVALVKLGFTVLRGENLQRQEMVDKLDEFARQLSSGDTAMFYFAGHGVAIGGGNYLLPTDIPNIEADQETRLARASLGETDIVSDLQARGVKVAVVVIDACRDNPFRKPGTRSVGGDRGLTRVEPARGIFTVYSAGINQSALDRLSDKDPHPNSIFTRVLIPALARPGVHLGDMVIEVREEVARLASTVNHEQRPAYYDETVGGRIYLAGAPAALDPSTAAPAATISTAALPDPADAIPEFLESAPLSGPFYARRAGVIARRAPSMVAGGVTKLAEDSPYQALEKYQKKEGSEGDDAAWYKLDLAELGFGYASAPDLFNQAGYDEMRKYRTRADDLEKLWDKSQEPSSGKFAKYAGLYNLNRKDCDKPFELFGKFMGSLEYFVWFAGDNYYSAYLANPSKIREEKIVFKRSFKATNSNMSWYTVGEDTLSFTNSGIYFGPTFTKSRVNYGVSDKCDSPYTMVERHKQRLERMITEIETETVPEVAKAP